jgi:hypothetical protein
MRTFNWLALVAVKVEARGPNFFRLAPGEPYAISNADLKMLGAALCSDPVAAYARLEA